MGRYLRLAEVTCLMLCAVSALDAQRRPATARTAQLDPRERAVQLLNRFTFGVRPGDVERLLALGTDRWISQELNPASIPDTELEKRLADYPTLRLTPAQALEIFPDRGTITLVADGKLPYPADPLLQGAYEVQVYKLQQERNDHLHPKADQTEGEKNAQKQLDQQTAIRIAGQLFALPKQQRTAALAAMPVPDRIAFAGNLPGSQRNVLLLDATPREREALLAMQGGVGVQYRILDELAQARQLRAILSERQLQEVMTEFWFNHFNIFAAKDSDQYYTTTYEREAIRPHALGRFRELLIATAESPAMQVYLDNWLSIGPNSEANGVNPRNPNSKPGKKGLNENYGREVMELHTVGVGGGYSQADVTHLAAILTGWGVDKPTQGGSFVYDPKKHEPGTKDWFGYRIDEQGNVFSARTSQPVQLPEAQLAAIRQANVPDGMKQGIAALVLLAGSPRTAHFISELLAQRFVADQPPPALVDRMTVSWLTSDGDIATVLRTLMESPEFNSRRFFRNKVKTPQEFVASAFRATDTDPENPGALVGLLSNQLGEPPYRKLEPTGYYVTADHWMNTQALMARLNFADQLTHNHFANQKFDSARVLAFGLMGDGTAQEVDGASTRLARAVRLQQPATAPRTGQDTALNVLERTLIEGQISPATDRFIRSQLLAQPGKHPEDQLNLLTALLLGSPEFQVR